MKKYKSLPLLEERECKLCGDLILDNRVDPICSDCWDVWIRALKATYFKFNKLNHWAAISYWWASAFVMWYPPVIKLNLVDFKEGIKNRLNEDEPHFTTRQINYIKHLLGNRSFVKNSKWIINEGEKFERSLVSKFWKENKDNQEI